MKKIRGQEPITPELIDRIVVMSRENMPLDAIADRLGVSRSTVYKYRRLSEPIEPRAFVSARRPRQVYATDIDNKRAAGVRRTLEAQASAKMKRLLEPDE